MIATIKPMEIHQFIQEHDRLALDGTNRNDGPLFLETLGIQEFCDIALLACTMEVSKVLIQLKEMAAELHEILE